MPGCTKVMHDGKMYALFFSRELTVDGIQFFTEDEDNFQVGLMERPAGYTVQPHRHADHPAKISSFSEFLYVEKGKVLVTVFDDVWNAIARQELSGGDFLLFLRGGHSLEVLEPARMVEVKQGPFGGDPKVFRDGAGGA